MTSASSGATSKISRAARPSIKPWGDLPAADRTTPARAACAMASLRLRSDERRFFHLGRCRVFRSGAREAEHGYCPFCSEFSAAESRPNSSSIWVASLGVRLTSGKRGQSLSPGPSPNLFLNGIRYFLASVFFHAAYQCIECSIVCTAGISKRLQIAPGQICGVLTLCFCSQIKKGYKYRKLFAFLRRSRQFALY